MKNFLQKNKQLLPLFFEFLSNVLKCQHRYLNKIGNFCSTKKFYKLSIVFYKAAIKLSPQWVLYWSNLSYVYVKLGRWNEAILCAETAIIRLETENVKHPYLKIHLIKEINTYRKFLKQKNSQN